MDFFMNFLNISALVITIIGGIVGIHTVYQKSRPSQQFQQPYPNNTQIHYRKKNSGCLSAVIMIFVVLGVFCILAVVFIGGFNLLTQGMINVKTDGVNLVKNFGAEDDFGNWEQNVPQGDLFSSVVLKIDTANAFKGNKCFYMKSNGNSMYIRQTLQMKKGKKYLVSLFEKGGSGYEYEVVAKFLFKSDTGENTTKFDVIGNENWKLQQKVINVPNNISIDQIPFTISTDGYGKGVYVDDVKVEEVID